MQGLIIGLLAAVGCGNKPAPIELPHDRTAAQPASDLDPKAPAKAPPRADDNKSAGQPDAVPAPSGATVGDLMPPLPRPAPRLFDGRTSAPALPDISCEDLAPGQGFTLARKIEVLTAPLQKGKAVETLELCQFNKWLARKDDEVASRTGRTHHFAAAFPGTQVASWTSAEVERRELGLDEKLDAGLAAGWAGLIPTGVPRWPAVAVVSARMYAGPLNEDVVYLRRARVLTQKAGRWVWEPLLERVFSTLDAAHLQAQCELAANAEVPACKAAVERIAVDAKQAEGRAHTRKRRLAGKQDAHGARPPAAHKKADKSNKSHDPLAYAEDADPQAAWLRDGRHALKTGQADAAIGHALRVFAVCGESTDAAAALLKGALQKAGTKPLPQVRPSPKQAELCEPLPDKAPPKERKK